jgi:hypothetical protein
MRTPLARRTLARRALARRALALLLVTAACATSRPGSAPSTSSNRALVTEADIPLTGTETAYELIQRIRPEFLRVHPAQGAAGANGNAAPEPVVMVNGQRVGALGDLRAIPASSLSTIRYYTIEEAKRRFGMQYGGGAIELTYRTH